MERFAKPGDFCPNPTCPDYQKLQSDQDRPNIVKVGKTRKGRQRFRCLTCGKYFVETSGQFMRSTLLDMDSRLRAARAIKKDETQASVGVFQMLKRRGHPGGPPATISDGWGGIDQAMIEVYGLTPEYSGHGRPPTHKESGADWLYLQMVKQHDERGHFGGGFGL